MRKNKQLVVDNKLGDCFRASLTSILDIPNDPRLPNGENYWTEWRKIFDPMGLYMKWERKSCWIDGYWVASVPSLNYPDICTHAIVMQGNQVAHDPSTKLTYETGRNLLGQDIVLGGYMIYVVDASLLHNFSEFKAKYDN